MWQGGEVEPRPFPRLWRYTGPHRARVLWATFLTVANKIFDIFPELLIGAAIDVVVNSDDSFIADLTGVESRWGSWSPSRSSTWWCGWPSRPPSGAT